MLSICFWTLCESCQRKLAACLRRACASHVRRCTWCRRAPKSHCFLIPLTCLASGGCLHALVMHAHHICLAQKVPRTPRHVLTVLGGNMHFLLVICLCDAKVCAWLSMGYAHLLCTVICVLAMGSRLTLCLRRGGPRTPIVTRAAFGKGVREIHYIPLPTPSRTHTHTHTQPSICDGAHKLKDCMRAQM